MVRSGHRYAKPITMKLHLRQIPAEGIHLEGEEDCPLPEMEADGVRCTGPMSYALDVGISSGAVWANGTIRVPVELRCVSCLEPFAHTIDVHSFAAHVESAAETVDLTPLMREDILLNLPAYPRCDREGGRVCPGNEARVEKAPGEAERKPDWSALDKLNLKK